MWEERGRDVSERLLLPGQRVPGSDGWGWVAQGRLGVWWGRPRAWEVGLLLGHAPRESMEGRLGLSPP